MEGCARQGCRWPWGAGGGSPGPACWGLPTGVTAGPLWCAARSDALSCCALACPLPSGGRAPATPPLLLLLLHPNHACNRVWCVQAATWSTFCSLRSLAALRWGRPRPMPSTSSRRAGSCWAWAGATVVGCRLAGEPRRMHVQAGLLGWPHCACRRAGHVLSLSSLQGKSAGGRIFHIMKRTPGIDLDAAGESA